MLALDLDLEADLGVDTVKQAETFAAVRQAYDIPRDDKLKLRDFPTLAHVIQFVHDRRPDRKRASAPGAGPAAASHEVSTAAIDAPAVEAAGRVPRRTPVPVFRPALEVCKASGVTLAKGSRVLVTADRGGVAKALVKRLGKTGATALVIDDAPAADVVDERVRGWLA